MIKMSDIMALCESGTGFVGGACVDTMPHLTLIEAVNELPIAIAESQIEFEDMSQHINGVMVESAITAMQTGSSVDADALVEMSFEDIKNKIKKFFEKILNFLKSIIAKLKVMIDKMRMSGTQLYAKYKDSPLLTKNFTGMTFEGYKFKKDLGQAFSKSSSKYESDVDGLIKIALGGSSSFKTPAEFKTAYDKELKDKDKDLRTANKAIAAIKDVDSSTREYNMAKALSGESSISKDSWKNDLKKVLFGGSEKVTLKFGTDFTVDGIKKQLADPVNLDTIKDEYEKIKTACEKKYNELQHDLDDVKKESDDKTSEPKKNGISVCSNYYSAYMTAFQNAYNVINGIKAVKVNAATEQNKQAKTIFGKFLTFKSGSKDESSELDADDAFELDVYED